MCEICKKCWNNRKQRFRKLRTTRIYKLTSVKTSFKIAKKCLTQKYINDII